MAAAGKTLVAAGVLGGLGRHLGFLYPQEVLTPLLLELLEPLEQVVGEGTEAILFSRLLPLLVAAVAGRPIQAQPVKTGGLAAAVQEQTILVVETGTRRQHHQVKEITAVVAVEPVVETKRPLGAVVEHLLLVKTGKVEQYLVLVGMELRPLLVVLL